MHTMKKIALSVATLATVVMAAGDIPAPHERLEEAKSPAMAEKHHFLDRFHFKGDLRLRYESIERDDADNKYRTRYRLRIGAKYDITDRLVFEVGMRSGFGNPTSGNQTIHDDEPLSDYFFQSLRFNVLGLAYKFDDGTLKVGRQPYMIYRPIKSQLVWDNDVSLNGVNYQYKDDEQIITTGIDRITWEENSVARDDVDLYYAQYVRIVPVADKKIYAGASLYYYDGLKGNTPVFGKSKGNTLVNGVYANDYHILEGFAEVRLGEVFGMPLKAAASVAYNTAADDNNFGYDVAFQLGKAKHVGDWQIKYSYTELEEDAVFAAYSDSDNFGGGTGAKGHAIRVKYKMMKKIYLAGNFFYDTLYESKSKVPGIEPDYERVQLDCIIKF
jgi:hypothetical protein